jgi:hypothetical protein
VVIQKSRSGEEFQPRLGEFVGDGAKERLGIAAFEFGEDGKELMLKHRLNEDARQVWRCIVDFLAAITDTGPCVVESVDDGDEDNPGTNI